MAAIVPKNLQLMAGRLANMERTVVRVRPMSNDAVAAGQTIHWRFPTNTLIDLHNLQFMGYASINQNAGAKAWGLPANMENAIESVQVVVNGQSVMGNNNDYGGYRHLWSKHTERQDATLMSGAEAGSYLHSGDNKAFLRAVPNATANTTPATTQSMRKVLQEATGALTTTAQLNASPPIPYNRSQYHYQNPDGGNGFLPPRRFPFLIDNIGGLLGGSYVRYIDTAVVGPVEIRIRLHPGNILYRNTESAQGNNISTRGVAAEGSNGEYLLDTAPDYTWDNMYMILDTISFADDFYRALLAERLNNGGIITIPYDNVHAFQKAISSNADTVTFNLATQSLNTLVATFRNLNYLTRNGKRWSNNAQNSNFFKFVSADNTKYHEGPFASTTLYQWQVNNKMIPSWPVNVDEAYALSRAAVDSVSIQDRRKMPNKDIVVMPNQYRDGVFAFIQALDHHSEGDKIISGVDTRGASSNMAFAATNIDVGLGNSGNGDTGYKQVQCQIWALTTATLEISAGQNVVTIF